MNEMNQMLDEIESKLDSIENGLDALEALEAFTKRLQDNFEKMGYRG